MDSQKININQNLVAEIEKLRSEGELAPDYIEKPLDPMKSKILTMCAGGNVRSVGLKYLLKYKYGHEALSCGQDANSSETIDMLCQWADYVIVLTEEYSKFVPEKYKDKLLCYDVGPDRFGYAFHPELLTILDKMVIEHGLFNKKNL